MEHQTTDTSSIPGAQRWRLYVLVAGSLLICALDFVVAPRTDARAAAGEGYGHHVPGLDAEDPDYGELRGWRRVWFNFRHFHLFWVQRPPNSQGGLTGLLASDGNSFANNFCWHFLGSLVLSALGLWLSRSLPWVFVCGTVVNVFHEYVAEGQYVDPSFIDLWLDQVGLLLAMLGYFFIGRRRRPGAAEHCPGARD